MQTSRMAAWTMVVAMLAGGAFLTGCSGSSGSDGARGPAGPPGEPGEPAPEPPPPPIDTEISESQDLPGANFAVLAVAGASGGGGAFQVGDTVSVTFSLKMDDDTDIPLDEMDSGSIYISGPTTNYNRVIERARDLLSASVDNGDGTWTYTFATPIPAAYIAPYNDGGLLGVADGVLTGQPLLNGTYTIGIEGYKNYYENGTRYRDSFNVTKDILFGTATVLEPREVVARTNCNRCHEQVQAHGTFRRETKLCVLCHTSGAQDSDGQSVDFRVMIHKIHNGAHLPSVNGLTTHTDGSRIYGTGVPYVVGGDDFSEVAFPAWPNLNIGMPRDGGYTALSTANKAKENAVLTGVTNCNTCHGDPDGAGPLAAPAQGDNAYTKQSRRACGSCHDDIDWTRPYASNGLFMPDQGTDNGCTVCHPASTGSQLSPRDGHLHPLNNPVYNAGINFAVSSVTEDGSGNGNGKVDPGEKVLVSFTIKNDAGADIPANTLSSMQFNLSGPTSNLNIVQYVSAPVAHYGAGPNYTAYIPQVVYLERVGVGNGAAGQVLATARTPHWTTGATTSVLLRTATAGGSSTLASAAKAVQNYVDVADVTNFARNDYVVVDDGGGSEEYLRIQLVDPVLKRLWFTAINSSGNQPSLRYAHASGATVKEVTLTSSSAYTLTAATGSLTTTGSGFANGAVVLCTYTTDFVMPSVYPGPINDSPYLDETWGDWGGKAIAPGTYTLTVYGRLPSFTFTADGENTTYSPTSKGGVRNFLVGSATTLEPYDLISSEDNCLRCHQDIYFHGGGRRGFDTCISCHGTAGSEDRAQYTAANAPATNDVTINFRTMLHKIHRGADLPDAATYQIVGFGSTAYPNNFGISTYEHLEFPALPSGVKNCNVCHGNDAWKAPQARTHPTDQAMKTRTWRATCGACHSDDAAKAHIDANTSPFDAGEGCAVCHGAGKEWPVEVKHKVR